MPGSCCGDPAKSEATKVAIAAAPQTTEGAAEQTTGKSSKSECCNDKPAKSEKRGCGCSC